MTDQAKLEAAHAAANETIRLKNARIRELEAEIGRLEAENERLKAKNEWLKAQMGLWVLRYEDRPKKASETDDALAEELERAREEDTK